MNINNKEDKKIGEEILKLFKYEGKQGYKILHILKGENITFNQKRVLLGLSFVDIIDKYNSTNDKEIREYYLKLGGLLFVEEKDIKPSIFQNKYKEECFKPFIVDIKKYKKEIEKEIEKY